MQAGQELAKKTLTDMLYPMDATSTAFGDAAALLVEIVNEYKGSHASLESSLQIVSLHLSDELSNRLSKSAHRPDHSARTLDRLVGQVLDGTEQADFVGGHRGNITQQAGLYEPHPRHPPSLFWAAFYHRCQQGCNSAHLLTSGHHRKLWGGI